VPGTAQSLVFDKRDLFVVEQKQDNGDVIEYCFYANSRKIRNLSRVFGFESVYQKPWETAFSVLSTGATQGSQEDYPKNLDLLADSILNLAFVDDNSDQPQTLKEALAEARKTGADYIVIDVSADWCAPCKLMLRDLIQAETDESTSGKNRVTVISLLQRTLPAQATADTAHKSVPLKVLSTRDKSLVPVLSPSNSIPLILIYKAKTGTFVKSILGYEPNTAAQIYALPPL
jgi:thiol-disulfide isomerase/thioredoxin